MITQVHIYFILSLLQQRNERYDMYYYHMIVRMCSPLAYFCWEVMSNSEHLSAAAAVVMTMEQNAIPVGGCCT